MALASYLTYVPLGSVWKLRYSQEEGGRKSEESVRQAGRDRECLCSEGRSAGLRKKCSGGYNTERRHGERAQLSEQSRAGGQQARPLPDVDGTD